MKERIDDSERQRRSWPNLSDLGPDQLEAIREHLTHKNRQKIEQVIRGFLVERGDNHAEQKMDIK